MSKPTRKQMLLTDCIAAQIRSDESYCSSAIFYNLSNPQIAAHYQVLAEIESVKARALLWLVIGDK